MRISDWSSDVCSSDLIFVEMRRDAARLGIARLVDIGDQGISHQVAVERNLAPPNSLVLGSDTHTPTAGASGCLAISRSAERRLGKSVSVRVDLGGRRIIKKKKQKIKIE